MGKIVSRGRFGMGIPWVYEKLADFPILRRDREKKDGHNMNLPGSPHFISHICNVLLIYAILVVIAEKSRTCRIERPVRNMSAIDVR